MSVAEKMRKLKGSPAYVVRDDLERILPQLTAVIEAAEREHPEPHNYLAILDDEGTESHVCPTCAALAELDKALS